MADVYSRGVDELSRAGLDELDDTAVRDAIYDALQVPIVRRGYDPEAVAIESENYRYIVARTALVRVCRRQNANAWC